MWCPYCNQPNSKVLDSRLAEEGSSVRRRRECANCGERFTTYERVDESPLVVNKKDGSREAFDSLKLFNGLIRACEKTKLTREELTKIVQIVEKEIRDKREKEVSSVEIGELVMQKLKDLDRVAYMRFASVYRAFTDIHNFQEEMERLQDDEEEK